MPIKCSNQSSFIPHISRPIARAIEIDPDLQTWLIEFPSNFRFKAVSFVGPFIPLGAGCGRLRKRQKFI